MGILLSTKHGVNPAIPRCYFCGNEKNEIILAGRLSNDAEAPKNAVWDFAPCDECKKLMEQGIILISVKDGQSGDNPYRTGGWIVLKEDAFKRIFKNSDEAVKKRCAFLEDSAWDTIGLPRMVPVR